MPGFTSSSITWVLYYVYTSKLLAKSYGLKKAVISHHPNISTDHVAEHMIVPWNPFNIQFLAIGLYPSSIVSHLYEWNHKAEHFARKLSWCIMELERHLTWAMIPPCEPYRTVRYDKVHQKVESLHQNAQKWSSATMEMNAARTPTHIYWRGLSLFNHFSPWDQELILLHFRLRNIILYFGREQHPN